MTGADEKSSEGPRGREPPRQKPEQQRGLPRLQRGRPDEVPPERRAAGREASDASARHVLYAAVAFFIGVGVAGALVWAVLALYREALEGPQVTATRMREIVPPEPRLEVAPERFGEEIDTAARSTLQSYAWADRDAGIARIPIEEAMRLIADHGWPDPFRPGDVVPPRAAIPQRTVPRATGDLLPEAPAGERAR